MFLCTLASLSWAAPMLCASAPPPQSPATPPTPPAKDFAVVDARIEMGDGSVLPKGSVLIHAGKVVQVGPRIDIPAGTDILKGDHLVVYPGFIDTYTTNGVKLPEAPAAGTPPDSRTTAPATMWHGNRKGIRSDVNAATCLDIKDVLADNYAQGITTAVIAPGSGTVRGQAAIVDYLGSGVVLNPRFGTELAFRSGAGSGYPGTALAVVALMRQVLADAQYQAAQTAPKKDPALDNLAPLIHKEVPALFLANTAREIVRANRVSEEFGFDTIVVGGSEAYRDLPLLKRTGYRVFVNIDPGSEPNRKPETTPNAMPAAVLEERYQTWVEKGQNVRKLNEAGVPYAFCTASNSTSDFLKNVRRIVATGVPKETVLKALTSTAAKLLGIGDLTGMIQPGKLGNLVVMNGDFADEKSQVVAVVVEGAKVPVMKEEGKK